VAIKWLYGTSWRRALLAFFAANALNAVAVTALMVFLF
jgi:hypothetical protein